LDLYLPGHDAEVEVRNINWKTTEDEFEKFLGDKKIGFSDFEFGTNNKGQFNGTCTVTLDKQNALKLIELHGNTFKGRDLKLVVTKPELDEAEEDLLHASAPIGVSTTSQSKQEEKKEESKQTVTHAKDTQKEQIENKQKTPLSGNSTSFTQSKQESKTNPTTVIKKESSETSNQSNEGPVSLDQGGWGDGKLLKKKK